MKFSTFISALLILFASAQTQAQDVMPIPELTVQQTRSQVQLKQMSAEDSTLYQQLNSGKRGKGNGSGERKNARDGSGQGTGKMRHNQQSSGNSNSFGSGSGYGSGYGTRQGGHGRR